MYSKVYLKGWCLVVGEDDVALAAVEAPLVATAAAAWVLVLTVLPNKVRRATKS